MSGRGHIRTRSLSTIADELRLIRLSLIELNGKADMLFSVLASIRNDQLRIPASFAAIIASKRPKKAKA